MKYKVLAILSLFSLSLVLVGCGNNSTPIRDSSTPLDVSQPSDTETVTISPVPDSAITETASDAVEITEDGAKTIALDHAGVSESDVSFINVHLERNDGQNIYEIEFISGSTEYDYDINAANGEIAGYDTDIEDYTVSTQGIASTQPETTIDESAAKSTALAKVPGATESDIRIHLDYDDGRPVFEGVIVYDSMKYEFEIDAADGSIIEWDAESVFDD